MFDQSQAVAASLRDCRRQLIKAGQDIRQSFCDPASRGAANRVMLQRQLQSLRRLAALCRLGARQIARLSLDVRGGDGSAMWRLATFNRFLCDQLASEQEGARAVLRQLTTGSTVERRRQQ